MSRIIIPDISYIKSKNAVVIPSYHKSGILRSVKNTFQYMCLIDAPCVCFLQDEADVPLYDLLLPAHIIFWVPPVLLRGIAPVRAYIQQKCTDAMMDTVCMLDDDLRFSYRDLPAFPTKWNNVCDVYCPRSEGKVSSEDDSVTFMDIWHAMYDQLSSKVKLTSIVQRFGSQNKIEDKYNNRILHVFMMDLQGLKEHGVSFNPDYAVCEDFSFLFDLAKAGLYSKTLMKYVQDDYTNTRAKGGCNEWRNEQHIAIHNECVTRLEKDYPTFCKKVWEEKSPYCSTGAFNPVVDWKALDREARRKR